jgi:ankyrin repeat protein
MDIRGQYEEWFRAIIAGDVEGVKRGIGAGLDIDARTDRGRTPLMLAARFGRADVADALIRAGADVDATVDALGTNDDDARDAVHLEKMQTIVESAADIPASDGAGQKLVRGVAGFLSALHAAGGHAADGRPVKAVFTEADEDDGFEPHELSTALCHAAAYGYTDVARRLVVEGADVDAPRWDCTPPLVHAAARGDLAMVGLLVGAGANPDDGFDLTALEAAAAHGHADTISRLLQAGATPDAMNENAQTPLMRAAENGHLTAVHVLIHGGADPNVWEQGETALLCAARSGHEDVVEYLEGITSEEIREWVRIEMRER